MSKTVTYPHQEVQPNDPFGCIWYTLEALRFAQNHGCRVRVMSRAVDA